jgi:hypothetical protein
LFNAVCWSDTSDKLLVLTINQDKSWSPVLFQEVFHKTVFSESVTKFWSAHNQKLIIGLVGSVLSIPILVHHTTLDKLQVPLAQLYTVNVVVVVSV